MAGLGSATGIVVEATPTRLRDIEADVVLYAPEGDLDATTTDLEILLEVGLNVVAILPELAYPPDDDDDDLAVSIDTLAREAEVTALALDPSDALLGTLPLSLTSVCSRVDRIVVRRRGADRCRSVGCRSATGRGRWPRRSAGRWTTWTSIEEEQGGLPRGHHRIVGSVGGREVLVVETLADLERRRRPRWRSRSRASPR